MHRRHIVDLPAEPASRRLQRANEQSYLSQRGTTLTPAMKARLREDRGGNATPRQLADVWKVRVETVESFLAGLDRGEDTSDASN